MAKSAYFGANNYDNQLGMDAISLIIYCCDR